MVFTNFKDTLYKVPRVHNVQLHMYANNSFAFPMDNSENPKTYILDIHIFDNFNLIWISRLKYKAFPLGLLITMPKA